MPVRFVTGSAAGLLGGCIYGFSGYQFGHFFLGQTNLLASEWFPACVLCLLADDAACGRRRLALVGAGALALLLLMLCDWHYVIFALAFAAWYGAVRAPPVAPSPRSPSPPASRQVGRC